MMHIRLVSSLGAMTVAIALTGCAAASGSIGALIPAVASATPTVSPTPEQLVGDKDGNGSVSEFEKQLLAKNAPRDYTMPDGSVVKVDPTQPLPAAIVTVIRDLATPIVASNTSARGETLGAMYTAITALADQQTAATGRSVVIFHHTWSLSLDWSTEEHWWTGTFPNSTWPVKAGADREAVLAAVTVAAAERNAELIVIDYDG